MTRKRFDSQFADAIQTIRRTFVLPEEKRMKEEEAKELLALLRRKPSPERSLRLASLSIDEQTAIYSLYALSDNAGERRAIDGLVIQYASWSLFDAGWVAFQYDFPNTALQRSLAWLWRFLQHNEDKLGSRPLYNQDLLSDEISLSLSAAEFLSESLKLMQKAILNQNGASLPIHSGVADPKLLERFLLRRKLISDSMFTALLLDLWAKSLDDEALYAHYPLLLPSWSVLPPSEFAVLLQRILTTSKMPDKQRSEMLHALMDQMTERREEGRAIEAVLSPQIQEIWQAWQILDAIKRHYQARPVKREFILSFHHKIISVQWLDHSTVAWNFGHFYMVDSLAVADRSYVYPEAIFKNALDSPDTFGNLGDPRVMVRTIDLPEDIASSQSIVEISYIEPELTKAKQFMRAKFRHKTSY